MDNYQVLFILTITKIINYVNDQELEAIKFHKILTGEYIRMITKKFQTSINSVLLLLGLTFLLSIFHAIAFAVDINVALMESTFKIMGPSKEDPKKFSTGTMFVVGRPLKSAPTKAHMVMVTAAHVLDSIPGDDAVIILRKKESDGSSKRFPFPIKIRENGKPLFVQHATADVVAMYLKLPDDLKPSVIPIDLLADDKIFEKYEIHPGDELLSLGYPFTAEANEAGFPILRSGKIASYPITPAKTVKTFLFDFRIFPGNSGGPVYMGYTNRQYHNNINLGESIQYIAGLVSQEAKSLPEFSSQPLALAVVTPAQFIKETINLLPEPDSESVKK